MEMAVVANATGFSVGIRGMYGPKCSHVNEVLNLFPLEKMNRCGLVDYILGAEPGPGVFLIGYNEDPIKRQYMDYFKMGEGPYYVFYTPYHLPHLEVPFTVARAVLFNDATITPIGKPVCEVVTASKRNLKKGEILDGIGGFLTYGVIDNAHICRSNNLLNMGLSEGCVLLSDIPKDYFIKVNDVIFPQSRVSNVLWDEQREHFDLP